MLLWHLAVLVLTIVRVHAQLPGNTTTGLPVYNIGVLFPDPATVRDTDPTLGNMIIASEVAIQMAVQHITQSNILPDVQLNITRYYSDDENPGRTAWTTFDLVANGVNAVIGDMVSDTTQTEAGITGIQHIPQCSCASASMTLSDKEAYPYFFRTIGNVILFGTSLVDWVRNMGWNAFALVYTNDNVGQQVLSAMLSKAESYGMMNITQVPLYDVTRIEDALGVLARSGTRVVIFADSTTSVQLTVLQTAMSLGLLSEGWVWILTNDMSPAIADMVETPEELALYDGLMFISGLWNLTGLPEFDAMAEAWKQQQVPLNVSDPESWQTAGMSYNAPNAYACLELLAVGLNKALNAYPGGRQKGLSDLSRRTFDSTQMTPTFYNMNYTSPAGFMSFSETGDLQTGYFGLQYMLQGSVVTYATLKDGIFEFENDTTVIYLGHTTTKPPDRVPRYALNPSTSQSVGAAILALVCIGIVACVAMMVLIIVFREHKTILAASPMFCCLQLIGLLLVYMSALLYLNKPNPAKCVARKLLITMGFTLVIGSTIAKSYRIYRVFQNVFTVRTSRLKSMYLLRIVAVIGVVAFIPLIIWHAVHPLSVEEVPVGVVSFCWQCVYPTSNVTWHQLNPAELVVLIWGALMILVSVVLAWKTRKVRGKWAETNQTAYASYNMVLAAFLVLPSFFLSNDDYVVSIYLKLSAILFAVKFTFAILFLPKAGAIAKHVYLKYRHRLLAPRYSDYVSEQGDLRTTCPEDHYAFGDVSVRNLLHFSVQAHEGMLPVKKVARFYFMSIWELKHVVVVPLKKFFVLTNQSSITARTYHYTHCEAVTATQEEHFLFKVQTEDGSTFLFQTPDHAARQRWIQWFKGPVDSRNTLVDAAAFNVRPPDHQVYDHDKGFDAINIIDPMTTFGALHQDAIVETPDFLQRHQSTHSLASHPEDFTEHSDLLTHHSSSFRQTFSSRSRPTFGICSFIDSRHSRRY